MRTISRPTVGPNPQSADSLPTSRIKRRRHSSLSGLTIVVMFVTLLLVPTAALAATETARTAAGWLAEELVDTERVVASWTDADGVTHEFDDHGGTADVVFALAAAGVAADHIRAAVDWLIAHADAATGAAFDAQSAGATAKLILALQTDDRDPQAAGVDLLDQLSALEQQEGPSVGRFSDAGDDDWSNVISQSLAIIALQRAEGHEPSPAAIDFLLAQQCADGGFPFSVLHGACDDATAIDGELSVDTTLIVVQALVAIGADATSAAEWLTAWVDANGGWNNANTAGLAAVAFDMLGEEAPADEARAFIVDLQADCNDDAPGSIAYDAEDSGDRLFATRQAVLGLSGVSYVTATSASASTDVPRLDCSGAGSTAVLIGAGVVALAALTTVFVVVNRRRGASTV